MSFLSSVIILITVILIAKVLIRAITKKTLISTLNFNNDTKIKFRKHKVIISRSYKTIQELSNNKEVIQDIISRRIFNIERKKRQLLSDLLILHTRNFKTYSKYLPKKNIPYHFNIFHNYKGEEKLLPIETENTLLIAGGQGSGKTQATLRILEHYKYNNPNYNFIIVDPKMAGYRGFQSSFYSLESLGSYQELNSKLESIIKTCQEANSKGVQTIIKWVVVFEEALDYFSKEKDSDKEIQREKVRLIENAKILIRKMRSQKIAVIIVTQDSSVSSLLIPSSFISNRLNSAVGNISQAQVFGHGKELLDNDLKNGRFIHIGSADSTKYQFPQSLHNRYVNSTRGDSLRKIILKIINKKNILWKRYKRNCFVKDYIANFPYGYYQRYEMDLLKGLLSPKTEEEKYFVDNHEWDLRKAALRVFNESNGNH